VANRVFEDRLGLAWLAGSLPALVVAALYAGWWVVRR